MRAPIQGFFPRLFFFDLIWIKEVFFCFRIDGHWHAECRFDAVRQY